MASNRKQLATLAGLLMVLAVVLWWQSREVDLPPPGATAAPGPARAQAPAPSASPAQAPSPAGGAQKVPAVALNLLQGERPEIMENGRDPFRFGARAIPARTAGPPAAAPPPPGVDRVPPRAEAPAGPPPPPPIAMKFIGIVKRSESGIVLAVLSDSKGVYYGAEGDVIEGRYRIVKIGNESIEMVYLDGRGQQRIPLTGA